MDEMLPFLRSIAENPEDDTARLVFSDWLEEHDHLDRAQFIRLQVELARMAPGDEGYAEKTAQMRRCGMFTRKGELPFFDRIPGEGCKIGFRRGLIELINTHGARAIDTSGLDRVPLQYLLTGKEHVGHFKGVTRLKWFEYYDREAEPARLLEMLGPNGWFPDLEELSLPELSTACLEAGVIPQFDLPRLRSFYLSTEAFYYLGLPAANGSNEDDDDYSGPRLWNGLAAYLPKNAIPSAKSPLERFVWHSDDDCDFFNDEDWYWRGPTMESLLEHLKHHRLKQVELAVDYDDHESGSEGVIAAPYQHNPLTLAPTLERVTLAEENLGLLDGSTRKLKALRVYGYDLNEEIFSLLAQPICSELESLHIEVRGGYWGRQANARAGIPFNKLKSLRLFGVPLGFFANCEFPNLITLEGYYDIKSIQQKKWPKLQSLEIGVESKNFTDLIGFATSDCCPNLTTLTIKGYYNRDTADFSFLAKYPHMPHLSLVRIPEYPMSAFYVVDHGRLVPIRSDITLDDPAPTTPYRLSAAF